MTLSSRIGAVASTSRTATELLLAEFVASTRASGARVVGLLADTQNLPDGTCAAGVLRDIMSGRTFSIRLEKPRSDTSCQLDADGVVTACSRLLGQIDASDLVVLSKFGKLEAMHSGLVAAFEAARTAGKPLLTSVSDKHRDAWSDFAPRAAALLPEQAVLLAWWQAAARAPRPTDCGSRW